MTSLFDFLDDPTPVVLSYGMGADSTAILLRWLDEPTSRDFDLADLVVITAMTGDEFPETRTYVESHVLPRLAAHGVRYVQVARAGAVQADGIVILDDSRHPTRLHLEGGYKLSDELAAAGTVPQVAAGRRLCSVKAKGWPLDTWLAGHLDGRSFRHVIGFESDETKRAERDTSYSDEQRNSEYPLIEWGWNREACQDYIRQVTGIAGDWPKSCCTYCPFARDNHLDRYRETPAAGAQAMRIEHLSMALNPRMTLFSSKSVQKLVDEHVPEAAEMFYAEAAAATYALYDVRRVFFAKRDDPTKKGSSARSVRKLAEGTHATCAAELRRLAAELDVEHHIEGGVLRAWVNRRGDTYPTGERMLVVAPTGVIDKERPSFATWWAQIMGDSEEMACA